MEHMLEVCQTVENTALKISVSSAWGAGADVETLESIQGYDVEREARTKRTWSLGKSEKWVTNSYLPWKKYKGDVCGDQRRILWSDHKLKKTGEIWSGQFDKKVQLKNQVTAKSTEEKIDRFDCIKNFLPDKFKQSLSKVGL